MRQIDVGVVGVSLVQVAVDTKCQRFGERAGEAERGAFGHAFGIVLGQVGVRRERTAEFLGRALGDDIHHAAHRAGAVPCGRRASQHLDALDFVGGHPIAVATGIALAGTGVTHGVA